MRKEITHGGGTTAFAFFIAAITTGGFGGLFFVVTIDGAGNGRWDDCLKAALGGGLCIYNS